MHNHTVVLSVKHLHILFISFFISHSINLSFFNVIKPAFLFFILSMWSFSSSHILSNTSSAVSTLILMIIKDFSKCVYSVLSFCKLQYCAVFFR